VLAMTVGGVRVARHRAHTAADLAARAAAAHPPRAPPPRRAGRGGGGVGGASRGRRTTCVMRGPVADVTVIVTIRVPMSRNRWRLVVRSRAGPSELARAHPPPRNRSGPRSLY